MPQLISSKILVLGLGNELLADDGIGIAAALSLKNEDYADADVATTSMHGIALLDYFVGYEKAIIIDAICTGKHEPGTIVEMGLDDLPAISAPSPHYTGLPEMIQIAKDLELEFPKDFVIYAIEAGNVSTIGERISRKVELAIEIVKDKVRNQIAKWNN